MAVRMNYATTPLAGHMAQRLDMQLGRVAMAPINRKPNLVKVSATSGDESREFEHMGSKLRNGSNVETIILAGGAGTRLFPLTQIRAKPAVPIAGSYRLIDVPISNCLNSGLKKIYVMTQYCSASLNRHVSSTYNFSNNVSFGNGFVEILAATQTPGEGGMNWFQGTADAVRQFDWLLKATETKQIQDILILSGDHLYQMDYMEFIESHRRSCADITISCLPMDDRRASDFGLMKIDGRGRVISFSEKPKGDALKAMEVDTTVLGLSRKEADNKPYIASMGIYVFKKDVLLDLLRRHCPTSNDFGSEVIPASAKGYLVKAFLFGGYWEDIGTIRSFYEANLSLTDDEPKFSFYNEANPMYTSRRSLPPSVINNCKITHAMVSDGCILDYCSIERCVIGLQSVIGANVFLKDTVMFGADFYESNEERARLLAEGKIPIGIGSDTTICNCILDKNVRVGKGVRISNSEGIREAGCSDGFYIKDGIVVVPKNSIIKDGLVV